MYTGGYRAAAAHTGETIAQAVIGALRERLAVLLPEPVAERITRSATRRLSAAILPATGIVIQVLKLRIRSPSYQRR